MPNALKPERDIENFFQTRCLDWAPKAQKLFVDAIEKRTAQLLTEKQSYSGIDLVWLANTEMFQLDPKFTLEVSRLFERAIQAKLPKRPHTKNVKNILRERVRLTVAKHKVNHYRRII
jgi:hypothetical protein